MAKESLFPLVESSCYLVHLDSSLGPLQCYRVGLLEPLGNGLFKPLVEVSQSKRAIPGKKRHKIGFYPPAETRQKATDSGSTQT